jgi:hypothetical protein
MSCKKAATSGGQVVSAIDPKIDSQEVDPHVAQDAFQGRHVAAQQVVGDPDGVVQEILGAPEVVQEPQVVDPDDVIQEELEDPEAGPPQQAVAMPEEHDLSLEVLAFMATVVFIYMATAVSYPFENLSFKYRFGVWAAVFVGLWLVLIIWWKRNNGDRNLLSRALRQIRGTGGF